MVKVNKLLHCSLCSLKVGTLKFVKKRLATEEMTTSVVAAATVAVAEYGPDSGGRQKGLTVVKPVVIGNSAKYFGKKREEDGHTHQWTVYLKPYPNEDYSSFIKKVHFKLHDSYANSNRVISEPPYEVTETGWGEFEVVIKIHFHDPVERPVTLYHILKLFQPGADPNIPTKKNLISEFYDEIVFQEPTAYMKELLDTVAPITSGVWKHEVDFEEKQKTTLVSLEDSRKKVKDEIHDLKGKLTLARETIDMFKLALSNAQKSPMGPPKKSGSFSVESVAGSSKITSLATTSAEAP